MDNFRSGTYSRDVRFRKPASDNLAQLLDKLMRVLWIKDACIGKEFRSASGIFRAQHGKAGEHGFVRDGAPDIGESRKDQAVSAAIHGGHLFGCQGGMEVDIFKVEVSGELFQFIPVVAAANEEQGKFCSLLLERGGGAEEQVDAL